VTRLVYLKQKIKEVAPNRKIRVNMSGCLDRCEQGPVQISYPEGEWFSLKSENDVDFFVKSYIQENSLEVIESLRVK
jgi:(2Fe-2S) ferredoxin